MAKRRIFSLFMVFTLILTLVVPAFANTMEGGESDVLSDEQIEMILETVEVHMDHAMIPGMVLVIVSEYGVVFSSGFGYADVRNQIPVTMDTIFEIASNSKAFTGLAILQLEQEGLLDLDAPVTDYIPWLEMYYNGERVTVTARHAMHHLTGIPFSSIDRIPASTADDAVEQTVRTLVDIDLDTRPGDNYLYATLNYAILGLLIETVSGQSYEEYIVENILYPMGLRNTHMFHEDAGAYMAVGHRMGFLRARVFDAPIFRGNKPSGYILSGGNDIALFMMTQLGFNPDSEIDQALIQRSHVPGTPTAVLGEFYAVGWFGREGEIYHAGVNPSFSSFIRLDTENGIGVAALSNLNTTFSEAITLNVMRIIHGEEAIVFTMNDMNVEFDMIAVTVICLAVGVILLMLFLLYRLIMTIKKKQRSFVAPKLKGIIGICLLVAILVGYFYLLSQLPALLMNGVGWATAALWAPGTVVLAAIFVSIAILLICLYLLLDLLYKQKDGIPLFFTVFVSVIAGLGNALIVFMINAALMGEPGLDFTILLFFGLGIVFYAGGSRIVRAKLIKITNNMIYKLRMELVNKILNTPLEGVEKLDDGVIQATLNNDTEVVSQFPNLIVNMITASATMIACFVFLGFINIFMLLVCVVTIVIIASIYFFVIQSANKLLEEARTTQNVFFKFINDIAKGFKELRLNIKRRRAFESDVDELSDLYNKKMGRAFVSLADAFVVGELVFTFAIGSVVFIFPLLFIDLSPAELVTFVFVLLFLTGPVNGILATIPNLVQIRVAWGRINKLRDDITKLAEKEVSIEEDEQPAKMNLMLKDATYEYSSEDGETFKVGPINCQFKSGEITFITGGNGSGKSTLAKMITGLYRAESGEVLLNDKPIPAGNLEQKYAAIFGDFHLFDKLYGIDYESKKEEFEKYMGIMQLNDKTKLEEGRFSTTELSTGQRKRLALVVSYLENRPIYLFDEWAADQDPEFREFFYKELLPELKQRGKCVIAITHDDRYFDYADRLIKMEWGQIVDY